MFDFNYSKKLIDFIWNIIKEENFSSKNVAILNTVSTINVDLLNSLSKDLFINTHPLNDFRRINDIYYQHTPK